MDRNPGQPNNWSFGTPIEAWEWILMPLRDLLTSLKHSHSQDGGGGVYASTWSGSGWTLMGAYDSEHSEVACQFVDGDFVITELRDITMHNGELTLATGEHVRPTGRTVTQEIVFVDHVVDGKIVEETAYFDRHAFLQQIGQA